MIKSIIDARKKWMDGNNGNAVLRLPVDHADVLKAEDPTIFASMFSENCGRVEGRLFGMDVVISGKGTVMEVVSA